jgi:DNA gyrase inhibitor GyrI
LIVLVLLVVLGRQGLFASVKISEKNVGPYLLVYKKHVGPYKNVGPVMDEVYNGLKDDFGIETTKGFGLYYDNPQEVEADKLRSIVGCIVEGKTVEDLAAVGEKFVVGEYPASQSVVAEFPYKGKMSIIIGVFKVYPKLMAYSDEKSYTPTPMMEVYDQPNGTIEYISSGELSEEIFADFLK